MSADVLIRAISIVSIVITAFFSFILLLAGVIGFFKGWRKGVVSVVRTLIAVLLAFLTILMVTNMTSLYEIVTLFLTDNIELVSDSEAIRDMADKIVFSVVMPFVFVIVFVIYDLLLMIPAHFIGKAIFGDTKKAAGKESPKDGDAPSVETENTSDNGDATEDKSKKSGAPHIIGKFCGALLCATRILLVITLLLMPTTGIILTALEGAADVAEAGVDYNAKFKIEDADTENLGYKIVDDEGYVDFEVVKEAIDAVASPLQNNFFLALSHSAPVKALYNGMVGSRANSGELEQVFGLASDAMAFVVPVEEYGDAQERAIHGITGYITESELHAAAFADIVSYVSTNIKDDKPVFGMDMSQVKDNEFSGFTIPLLERLSKSDREGIKRDFITIRNMLCIAIKYNLPAKVLEIVNDEDAGYDQLLGIVADDALLYEMLKEIYANEDFGEMVAPTVNCVFSVAMKNFFDDAGDSVVCNSEMLTDEQIRSESTALAKTFDDMSSVVATLPQLSDSEDAMTSIETLDMEALGQFVDDARESLLIGKGITETLTKILATRRFDKMRGIADILIKHIKNDENLNVKNLMIAVKQFVIILNSYEKTGNCELASLTRSLTELNTAFDESTSEIMKEIINDSSLLGSSLLQNGSSEDNKTVQKLMTVLVDSLASGDISPEKMEQEAKAVDYAMKLVKASSEESPAETIKAIYNDEDGMKEMVEIMADSTIASASINAIAYDEEGNLTPDALEISEHMTEDDKDKLVEKCEELYKEEVTSNADCDREALENNLRAVAAIFGRDITSEIAGWNADLNRQN